MMRTSSIVVLTLAQFALISGAVANNETDSDLRLFFVSTSELQYAKGHAKEPEIGIYIGRKEFASYVNKKFVANFDYHAGKGRLYWTSPRFGYWSNHAKLYSVDWDYDFSCYDEKGEMNRHCYVLKENHRFYVPKEDIKVLREVENWNPRSLAVDYIGDKLYVVDTSQRAVNIFDLEGKNKSTVFENETLIPYEVALDPPEGLMFVAAVDIQTDTMQIYRVNMDGTAPCVIVENVEVLKNFTIREKFGFTLDTVKKMIYFANFGEEIIERVDYEGKGRLTVTKAKYPISISVYKETLYWSNSSASAELVFMCFKSDSCSIWRCKLNETGACNVDSIENINKAFLFSFGIHTVKAVDRRLQLPIPNPCGADNGGCQHHCLLKSADEGRQNLDFGCVCNDGYQLMSDLKKCSREKVNYTYVDYLIPRNSSFTILYNSPEVDISFIPRHLLIQLLSNRPNRILHQMPFRYFQVVEDERLEEVLQEPPDSYNGNPAFDFIMALAGLGTLNSRRYQMRLLSRPDDGSYFGFTVAYDWIARNLYYVKLYDDGEYGDLMLLRYDKPDNVKYEDYSPKYIDEFLAKIVPPVGMAVHPYRGYLYLVTFTGLIIRLNTDASNELIFPNVNDPYVLTVDLTDDKVYWADSDGSINYADLDGSNVMRLRNIKVHHINFLSVFGNSLYARNTKEKSILRFDKITGRDTGSMSMLNISNLYRESVGVKVSARDAQQVDLDHPCADSNGGCEMFCFALPEPDSPSSLRRECSCGDYRYVLQDGLKCQLIKEDSTAVITTE